MDDNNGDKNKESSNKPKVAAGQLTPHALSAEVLKLSPRRNTSQATNIEEMVEEQLLHFGLDPGSDFGG